MKRINWGPVIFLCLLITAPALTLFAAEFFQRETVSDVIAWAGSSYTIVLISYFILFFLFLSVYALFGCTYVSLAVYSAVVLLPALVNKYKIMFLGEPLYPWDIVLYKNVFKLFPQLSEETGLRPLIILLAAVLLIVAARYLLPNFKLKIKYRAVLAVLSLAVLVGTAFYQATPVGWLFKSLNIQNIVWRQDVNYDKNGFILSYLLNTQSIIIFPPENYSKAAVADAVNSISDDAAKADSGAPPAEKPNIIIVMNEAFWDPTLLKAAAFSEDPMPTVRELQSGWLLSPTIGGYTSNVEFEALTGFSNAFLPNGSVPYQQYINKPLPSLANVLQREGYYPVAIHPFHKWFWNRDEVYRYIGFEKFIGLDDFKNAPRRAAYTADSAVSQAIIDEVNKSEKPVFIYAVTMQNHGPYEANRYKSTDIELSGSLSNDSLAALKTYAQGVKDGDTALKMLIDYFKTADEPTMIVFFGDHLPYLGENNFTYKEAGFIHADEEQWSLAEYRQMHSTPLVVWSSFKEKSETPDTLSPAFLPPYVLKYAGLQLPRFYKFLDDFSAVLPGFSAEVKIDAAGRLYNKLPGEYDHLAEQYWLLQYDLLFGKQYSLELEVMK